MLDLMTAAPKTIKIGNRQYLVGALKLKELGLLIRWIRDNGERPLERLKKELEYADPDDHRQLRYEAWVEERDDWPPSPISEKGSKILFGDTPGQAYFLKVFLGKHQAVSDEEIESLLAVLDLADLSAMVMIAYGTDDLDPEEVWAAAKKTATMRANLPVASRPPAEGPRDSTGSGESSSSTSMSSPPT